MLRALLLLACLALAAPATAQNCSNALQRAETSYQSGDFDNAIDRLTTCIEAGRFSDEERRQAYRLIGLSYIGKDREADARAAVAALLDVAPNYEPDPAIDPPPFVRMVTEMRRRRPNTTSSMPGERVASTAKGFNASFRAHGMAYSDSDEDSFSGGGGDLVLGYALSPALSIQAQLAGSSGSADGATLALAGFGLGGRFHINGGKAKLVPFVGAALASQSATFDIDGFGSVDYSGVGGEVEGGILYFFSPSLALDTGLSAAFTSLGNDTRVDDISATTVRVGVGVSWRP